MNLLAGCSDVVSRCVESVKYVVGETVRETSSSLLSTIAVASNVFDGGNEVGAQGECRYRCDDISITWLNILGTSLLLGGVMIYFSSLKKNELELEQKLRGQQQTIMSLGVSNNLLDSKCNELFALNNEFVETIDYLNTQIQSVDKLNRDMLILEEKVAKEYRASLEASQVFDELKKTNAQLGDNLQSAVSQIGYWKDSYEKLHGAMIESASKSNARIQWARSVLNALDPSLNSNSSDIPDSISAKALYLVKGYAEDLEGSAEEILNHPFDEVMKLLQAG